MKKPFLAILVTFILTVPSVAQTISANAPAEGTWRYAFSQDGRQSWKPEFTLRTSTGFVTTSNAVSAGIRVDNKRTLGIMIGVGDTYLDAAPGDVYAVQTAACMRRYVHLGKKDIVALYGDFFLGAQWVYEVSGKYWTYHDPDTGEQLTREVIDDYDEG